MKNFIKEVYPYVLVILAVVLIRLFIITPVTVKGPSMNETLHEGDIMILNKLNKNNIKRDDIIVFYRKNERLIKRVLALPGEKIKCVSGVIYINNEVYDDKYATGTTKDFEEYTLEVDQYFAVGDNRENSYDSRYFGPINKDSIQGITNFRLFPFDKFGGF